MQVSLSTFSYNCETPENKYERKEIKKFKTLFFYELFSAVWGMDSMGEIATVTVHIKKIRKKTENANVKSGYIETVWGSGYRFRVIDSDVSGQGESIVDAI